MQDLNCMHRCTIIDILISAKPPSQHQLLHTLHLIKDFQNLNHPCTRTCVSITNGLYIGRFPYIHATNSICMALPYGSTLCIMKSSWLSLTKYDTYVFPLKTWCSENLFQSPVLYCNSLSMATF